MMRQLLLRLIVPLVIAIGAIGLVFFWLAPTVKTTRARIDTDRANLLALQQQETNLKTLAQQQDQVHTTQTALNKEIWQFSQEDNFFAALATIARQTGTTIPDPKISDVAPSSKYLNRAVTLTVIGTIPNTLKAITAIQNLQPLIAINTISLQGNSTVTASISAATVWQ